MPQNSHLKQLHFPISNLEVEHLEITIKVDLGLNKHTLPKKYLTVTEIAYYLSQRAGENWTPRRVNGMLENMKYQQFLYKHWQPTIKGQHYATSVDEVLKWSPEVINLILQQLPQQLRLAV
ncbi:MAG: hypothetical protein HEQ24_10805 [Dolichospermum sp. BR01]|nr:hypothetical protein [Dolichospermum sp. BR01]